MQEHIDINAKGNILDVLKKMNEGFERNSKSSEAFQQNAASSLNKIESSMKSVNLAAFHQNLQNVNQGLQDLNAPGLEFNASLKDLSALTGLTGKDLDQLGDKARASAKEFGGNAAASINTYKTLLGRLGPDIAKSKESLGLMERNVQIMSKTMGGDAAGAVDALTTGMLQFGVDLSKPKVAAAEMTKMMDVMANSAQLGAAEVPQISAALKVSGVAAKQAKVSFIETNAAIQALAAGGKEGSEAGMALRNVLGKMAGEDVIPKEAADKLKKLGVNMDIVSNTSLPFTTRLRELKKAQGDATIMAQVFGTENAAAANILLSSVDAQDKLATQIGKTGGAQAQANIVMESTAEKMARMKASIDDAKLSFFEATGGATAYLQPMMEVMTTVNSFAPVFGVAKSAVLALATAKGRQAIMEKASTAASIAGSIATKAITAAQWLWNAALAANPIGLVIGGLALLGTAIFAATRDYKGLTATQKMNAEISSRVSAKTIDQRVQIEKLFTALKTTKKGTDEYKDVLKKIDEIQPGLTKKYNLQAGALNDINKAEKELIKNIQARAEAEVLAEMYTASVKKRMQFEAQERKNHGKNNGLLDLPGLDDKSMAKIKNTLLAEENRLLKRLGKAESKNNKSVSNSSTATEEPAPPLVSTSSSKGKESSSSSDKVMSGAGEVKRVDVRIQNLINGDIILQSTTLKEGLSEIKKQVSETLIGAVRDFEVAI